MRFHLRPPITSHKRRNGGSSKHSWWDVAMLVTMVGQKIDNCSCRRAHASTHLIQQGHIKTLLSPAHLLPSIYTLLTHNFSQTTPKPSNQTPPFTTANMSKNWTQETFTLNTVSNRHIILNVEIQTTDTSHRALRFPLLVLVPGSPSPTRFARPSRLLSSLVTATSTLLSHMATRPRLARVSRTPASRERRSGSPPSLTTPGTSVWKRVSPLPSRISALTTLTFTSCTGPHPPTPMTSRSTTPTGTSPRPGLSSRSFPPLAA